MEDYLTISERSDGLFKDRGSKFHAVLLPLQTDSQLKPNIDALRKEHPTARHFCFAFRLGQHGEQYRSFDDGEPSGSAGKPILNQLQSANLTNVLLVVIRYFGGTKLGVSGLINAYKLAAIEAIVAANIETRTIFDWYELECSYEQLGDINNLLRDCELEIVEKRFEQRCFFTVTSKNIGNIGVLDHFSHLPDVVIKFVGRR